MGSQGTLRKRQLGRELRRMREEAGLSLEEAAPKLDWSASKLGRIETADQGVDVHGVRSMLDLYDVGGGQWTEIIDMTREAQQKGWWHSYGLSDAGYVALETDAAIVYDYQFGYVPGLLQTVSSVAWSKSSRSNAGSEQTNCVEVAELRDRVAMRDSKDPAGPVLAFTRAEWRAFLGSVRASDVD